MGGAVGLVRALWSVEDAAEISALLRELVQSGSAIAEARWCFKVRRDSLLEDGLRAFQLAGIKHLLAESVKVVFIGEPGIDAGGVTRDFFNSFARALARSRWLVCGADGCLLPTPLPSGEALDDGTVGRYSAVGRFLATALLHKQVVPLHFNAVAYKLLLGREVDVHDIKALDPQFFENRIQTLMRDGGVAQMEAVLMSPHTGFAGFGFRLSFDDNPEHLPSAHTCANNLVLPSARSKEAMKEKLDIVIAMSEDLGFGFA